MRDLFFIFLSFIFLLSPGESFGETLYFTAIPDEGTARLEERFDKVAVYLEERLGVDVEYVPVKSYSASVSAFKNNHVQLAWFGGLSGVIARRAVPGSLAIAQGEEDTRFVTYIIANSETGLTASEDFPEHIRGRTFIFGSKGSTSGRLMPEYYIREHFKEAPRKIFRRVGFSGDHSKTIALVQSGSYEVGAVNYKVWEEGLESGRIDTSKVRVIWKTPEYPDYNWTVRGDLDESCGEGVTEKLREALLAIGDDALLSAFHRTRFIESHNSIYAPILETAIEVGIIDR